MLSKIDPRRTITVDNGGKVTRNARTNTGSATRQPNPPPPTLATRGNAISASEAVRAVQHPESDTPQTRAYYRMAASESETLAAVRAAGGGSDFLFAGRAGNDEEDDNKRKLLHLEKENHWRKEAESDFGQRDGDDLYPTPQPFGTSPIPIPIGGVDSEGNLGDMPLQAYPLLTGDHLSFMSNAFGIVGFIAGGVALFVPAAAPIAVGSTRISLGLASAAGLSYAMEGEYEEALEETLIPLGAWGFARGAHGGAVWAIRLADQVLIPLQQPGRSLFSQAASEDLLDAYELLLDGVSFIFSSGTDAGDE